MKKNLKLVGIIVIMISFFAFSYTAQANSLPEDPPVGGGNFPPPPPPPPPDPPTGII